MDDSGPMLPIILQIVLIALNAVFASAEIAVISMKDTKDCLPTNQNWLIGMTTRHLSLSEADLCL